MRLLITRPEPDAALLADELRARGHEPVIAPLMAIAPRPFAFDTEGIAGVLFTSANGVRAFAEMIGTPPRDIPVYAVGPASAEAARAAGWGDVTPAGGDVHSLAALVTGRVAPGAGRLLHLSGKAAAGDLAGDLSARGYDVARVIAYEAQAAAALPAEAADALRANRLDGVLLFSPRTARLYAELVAAAGLSDAAGSVTAYCLSQAVADALGGLSRTPKKVASAPETGQLLALLSP